LKIIPEFYESEVFEDYVAFHEGVGTRLGENHKASFEYFPSNIRGKLLDVGCGDGRFLRHAKEQGFEVWGIDFDKKSVESAKRNLGIDTVFAMSLEEFYEYAKEKNLKFDVITFFEVLEHQDKPREFLEMVKGLLRDGGYIAGSVPNRESVFVKIIRDNHADYPPHHYLEKKLFGDLYKLKIKLKGMMLGDERKARAYGVEELVKVSPSKGKAYILMMLKFLRNAILLPFALGYARKLKENGLSLYFQAKI
jgi:SAM-dependent methyltransferase